MVVEIHEFVSGLFKFASELGTCHTCMYTHKHTPLKPQTQCTHIQSHIIYIYIYTYIYTVSGKICCKISPDKAADSSAVSIVN